MDRKNGFRRRKREKYRSAPSISSKSVRLAPREDLFIVGHVSCVGKKERGVGSVHFNLQEVEGERGSSVLVRVK